jgi:hypothetical protein
MVLHPAATMRTMSDSITISCDDCTMLDTTACEDCVVSFILDRAPDDALVIDAEEARAVRMLGDAGLVPRLRHVRAG